MNQDSSILSCCRTLVNCSETALLVVDSNHMLINLIMPHTPGISRSWDHFIGKSFIRFANRIFGEKSPLIKAYNECLTSGLQQNISKLEHHTVRDLQEFFSCRISRLEPKNLVLVCLKKITDSVMIEHEFLTMSEQYNDLSFELNTAISKLDFQLMDMEQTKKKISALYKITTSAQNLSSQSEIINDILQGINREFGFSDASIWLYDEKSEHLHLKSSTDNENPEKNKLPPLAISQAVLKRELIYIDALNKTYFSEVAIPLMLGEALHGALHVRTNAERIIQQYDLDLLRSLASQIALTLAHASYVKTVEHLAITDGLTNLYNKRFFMQRLDEEVKRSLRYNRSLSLLIMDIDFFKHYNDTNGHPRGDVVLAEVARIIKACCRDVDFVARYGGEEFVALLPETTANDAYCLAERIRKRIESTAFFNADLQPNGHLTVSIGISCSPDSACSADKLIEHADIALYKVKKSSRNSVSIYSGF